MIDPAQILFDSWYDWIASRGYGVPVLRRRANAPAPKGHYLVIDDSVGIRPVGRVSKGYQSPIDYQSKVNDYRGQVAIWEIGGGSAILAQMVIDLELQDSLDHFEARKVSILKPGEISPIPDLDDEQYREQYRVPFEVLLALGAIDETLSYIETVPLKVVAENGAIANQPPTEEIP